MDKRFLENCPFLHQKIDKWNQNVIEWLVGEVHHYGP
jgi:hypothetical protein